MENIKIISIDPGINTGVAEFLDGKLTDLDTYTPLQLIWFLNDLEKCVIPTRLICIEDSRLQSFIFQPNAIKGSKAKAMTIARNIGQVDQLCQMVEEFCGMRGLKIMQIRPKDKGAKMDAETFKTVTGWEKRTNQHQRDSAMVGWRMRNVNIHNFRGL